MGNNYPEIRELLQQKADLQARLNLLPYDGTPEIKEQSGKQYIYMDAMVRFIFGTIIGLEATVNIFLISLPTKSPTMSLLGILRPAVPLPPGTGKSLSRLSTKNKS